ncbi:MAG: zinc-finger domain-containing protein [Alphaproteobacteria bacterium]
MDAPETVETETAHVSCDGGGGAAGHPKVYLVIGDAGFVECPYCDKRYALKAGAKRSVAH